MNDGGDRLRADLARYYDQSAAARAARTLPDERIARREWFVARLREEVRRRLIEVGTGPGIDAAAFQAAGFDVAGVTLDPPRYFNWRTDEAMAAAIGRHARLEAFEAWPVKGASGRTFRYQWAVARFGDAPPARQPFAGSEAANPIARRTQSSRRSSSATTSGGSEAQPVIARPGIGEKAAAPGNSNASAKSAGARRTTHRSANSPQA